ncbi:NAD(P)/FAD-dependent oxidoreductase [Sphingobium sp. DEHP117]|uniref:flavin-containing monooxygenase n=1 Tax=Sphingobium sp. DEHP117 TaxID=2993436 RepID=UPI0027D61327|nr:NAD(P)-binding domain-containing protein [Sphingobium sp. DEHP117]MDQ4421576.1 NAD(P)/FAD-dependent oxidoreductase [Sphingobium sp. DEHP117]
MARQEKFDAVVVGAGFSGLYMLHLLRQQGLKVVLLETAPEVGGTWYWNRYPGLRCDIESMQYCYTFDKGLDEKWRWSERFPRQPEILEYLKFAADHLDLRRDIRFETRLSAATWIEDEGVWRLESENGDTIECRYCAMATGLLAEPVLPDIPGVGDFEGQSIHSARWPEGLNDFTGKRVGLVGTGSSGVQLVPELAKTAKSLHVLIRTPPFAQESHNRSLEEEEIASVRAEIDVLRERARHNATGVWFRRFSDAYPYRSVPLEERQAELSRCWGEGGNSVLNRFNDVLIDPDANAEIAQFMRDRIAEIVDDPETARLLSPHGVFAAKRLPIGTGYHAAFNRDNVHVVALKEEPIETIHAGGVRTTKADYPFDVLVYATGYDAGTGALSKIKISGRNGADINQRWADDGPGAFMGIIAADFPNFFILTGPGSPGVLSNVVVMIEMHCEWTAECIDWMERNNVRTIDARQEDQDAWMDDIHSMAEGTLVMKEDNWYTGSNIAGKKRGMMFYMAGLGTYRKAIYDEAAKGYSDFVLERGES